MVMYRARAGYAAKIEKVDVIRTTKKQVVISGPFGVERRENKVSTWHNYFDSWEEAHAFLVEESQKKVHSRRRVLAEANREAVHVQGMEKPSQ